MSNQPNGPVPPDSVFDDALAAYLSAEVGISPLRRAVLVAYRAGLAEGSAETLGLLGRAGNVIHDLMVHSIRTLKDTGAGQRLGDRAIETYEELRAAQTEDGEHG